MRRKLLVLPFAALIVLILMAAASGLLSWGSENGETVPSTIDVSTGSTDTGATSGYGLVKEWEDAYNGGSSFSGRDYHLNRSKPSTTIAEECGNCHMQGFDDSSTFDKHEPPLHPLGLGASDTGDWFFDDDKHRGPNTRLADQLAGIAVNGASVYCGDCHSPTNASGFADSANSGRSSDPHSVHRDVATREGCIRCHNKNDVTFSDSVTFTQSNATRDTYGVANPVNMTRVRDGQFLSTAAEATYNASLGNGTGWNRYGSADGAGSTRFGCGDCHGQLHAEGAFGFTFNDSAGNRKGPLADVESSNSWGVNSSGEIFVCRDCHATDAHAVHTNGKISTSATFDQVYNASDQSIINDGVRGAELCDECHDQNAPSGSGRSHYGQIDETGLGDRSDMAGSHDRLPNRASAVDGAYSLQSGDCGFCHQ